MGPPRIIQCDNGKEFKGAVLHILQRHGIKLINSTPRHPQSQGLVEQGNSVVERKLRALMAERGTREWGSLLVEVSIAMNSEVHSTLRLTPYEIVFNQRMRIDDWVPIEEREQAMLHMAQDEKDRMVREIEEELENTSEIDERYTPPFLRAPTRVAIHDSWLFTSSASNSSSTSDSELSSIDASLTSSHEHQLQHEIQQQLESSALQLHREKIITQVRSKSSKDRERMITKYNTKRQSQLPRTFEIGDYVTVFIPRQDRSASDDRRLAARVIALPHANRYQLQTDFGILKHHYGTRHLEPVPDGILPVIADNTTVITLRAAAKAISRNPTGSKRAYCNCKTSCTTKRCGCYKTNQQCNNHCHPRGVGNVNCQNLYESAGESAGQSGGESADESVDGSGSASGESDDDTIMGESSG